MGIDVATIPTRNFDFLGFTFRPRLAKFWEGKYGVNFSPAVSAKAMKSMRATIRVGAFIGSPTRV